MSRARESSIDNRQRHRDAKLKSSSWAPLYAGYSITLTANYARARDTVHLGRRPFYSKRFPYRYVRQHTYAVFAKDTLLDNTRYPRTVVPQCTAGGRLSPIVRRKAIGRKAGNYERPFVNSSRFLPDKAVFRLKYIATYILNFLVEHLEEI